MAAGDTDADAAAAAAAADMRVVLAAAADAVLADAADAAVAALDDGIAARALVAPDAMDVLARWMRAACHLRLRSLKLALSDLVWIHECLLPATAAVDYRPLGITLTLHAVEVLYDEAWCLWRLQQVDAAAQLLSDAFPHAVTDRQRDRFERIVRDGVDAVQPFCTDLLDAGRAATLAAELVPLGENGKPIPTDPSVMSELSAPSTFMPEELEAPPPPPVPDKDPVIAIPRRAAVPPPYSTLPRQPDRPAAVPEARSPRNSTTAGKTIGAVVSTTAGTGVVKPRTSSMRSFVDRSPKSPTTGSAAGGAAPKPQPRPSPLSAAAALRLEEEAGSASRDSWNFSFIAGDEFLDLGLPARASTIGSDFSRGSYYAAGGGGRPNAPPPGSDFSATDVDAEAARRMVEALAVESRRSMDRDAPASGGGGAGNRTSFPSARSMPDLRRASAEAAGIASAAEAGAGAPGTPLSPTPDESSGLRIEGILNVCVDAAGAPGGGTAATWIARWCELRDATLRVYKDRTYLTPQMVIPLRDAARAEQLADVFPDSAAGAAAPAAARLLPPPLRNGRLAGVLPRGLTQRCQRRGGAPAASSSSSSGPPAYRFRLVLLVDVDALAAGGGHLQSSSTLGRAAASVASPSGSSSSPLPPLTRDGGRLPRVVRLGCDSEPIAMRWISLLAKSARGEQKVAATRVVPVPAPPPPLLQEPALALAGGLQGGGGGGGAFVLSAGPY
ncbi:hypothetical protein HK405_009961 [Cladochytrium tenue]|nr:hypothetical protein HK405_009961 [Cladochytrium tenue]